MDIAHIDTSELVGELLGHAPLAVAWKDADHVFQGCNEAFAQLAGLASPDEIVGRHEDDLPLYGADDGAAFGRDERVLRTGRTVNSVETRRLPGGETRRLAVTRIRAQRPDGSLHGLLLLVRDLQGDASLSLDAATGAASSGSDDDTERTGIQSANFLRRLGHEIRTPMTSILGFSNILASESEDEETRRMLRVVERSGRRALGLIDDLLDLAGIESGRTGLRLAAMNPHRTLHETVEEFQGRAEALGVDLRVDYLSAIPDVISSDERRLAQVLRTLLATALQLSGATEVSVQPAWVRASGREWLEITIVDTGDGLPPELLDGLFEPFGAVPGAREDAVEGSFSTGLGLVIARHVARLLGGELGVESTRGAGTTYSLRIDAGVVPSGVRWSEGESAPLRPSTTQEVPLMGRPLAGQRVLLAEDDDDNRAFMRRALESAGAEVSCVRDGQEAVELILAALDFERPFDVVVLNAKMPRLDGIDATVMMRELGCNAPVVALSADSGGSHRERCALAGCDGFVTKPMAPETLVQACAQWVVPRAQAA
ncbi:MAG: response regulator [Planctomycetota bacterium]